MRKETFCPGQYYHIYSRTALKVNNFEDNGNAKKLAQAFFVANSTKSTQAFDYIRKNINPSLKKIKEIVESGEKLVNIVCYSIMPNHYHLLLEEIRENGVTEFVRKCNTSIAKYVNIKTGRKGSLFESKFKSKLVNSNEYLLHLSLYIHLNPLDFLSSKEWRFSKVKNWETERSKLVNYPWSSVNFFLGEQYPNDIVSGTEIILSQFKNKKEYEMFLREWSEESFESIREFILE